jgi:UDP-N-acetylmuramoyl-tripeptide--D-alanyl-D-alanine ligase
MTLAEIAAATGGQVAHEHASVEVSGPATVDSREVPASGLFVAVAGTRADGHDFAAPAVAAGAAAALVSRPVDVAHVLVDDVVEALARLARLVVDRLVADHRLTVVGLTGSSGKTSTKDLLAQLLEPAGPTVAPVGSFNNELGVPLTALRADRSTRFLVVEMGARGTGHISALCAVTPPRVGVVLNVGSAHAGEFGGRAATARAKAELVRALPPAAEGGVAVLNADDPLVAAMAEQTTARVVWTGCAPSADIRASGVRLDRAACPTYDLHTPGDEPVQVHLPLPGAHHVPNSLAAAAVALECGRSPAEVADSLRRARPRSRWRMEVTERVDGLTVVNDAYNANPESVRAALEALVAMAGGRRTWAVLGEMLELGAASTAEHERVGRLARGLGVDRLVVVGDGARAVHTGALDDGALDGEGSVHVPDVAAALALLRPALGPEDVVLIKASRSAGLETVAAGLLATSPDVARGMAVPGEGS